MRGTRARNLENEHVAYSGWLKSKSSTRIRVVRGGDADDVADQTLDALGNNVSLIVDRSSAGRYAATLSLRAGPKVNVRVSRGFQQNLAALTQERSTKPAFMHAELFRRDLVSEGARISQGMLAVANYGAKGSIIASLLFSRLRAMFASYEMNGGCSLIIHDDALFLPLTLVVATDATTFGAATASKFGPIPGVLAADEDLPIDEVLRHAEFLARAELPSLIRMHDFLIGTQYAIAFEHWRECFRAGSREPGHERFVLLGIERLDEIQKALNAITTKSSAT
jgi:hypothetical protein